MLGLERDLCICRVLSTNLRCFLQSNLERVSVLRHSAYKSDALAEITYIAGEPLISSIIQISKPDRRVYWNRRTLKAQTCRRFGTFLLSTAKGIVNTAVALPMFGGEVVCKLV
ncbi:MAG: 30S ribosomal protein S8 [Candidatus Hodgkinia cicadicola]